MGEVQRPAEQDTKAEKSKEQREKPKKFVAEYEIEHLEKSDDSTKSYSHVIEIEADDITEAEVKARAMEKDLGSDDEMGRNTYTLKGVFQGHVVEKTLRDGRIISKSIKD